MAAELELETKQRHENDNKYNSNSDAIAAIDNSETEILLSGYEDNNNNNLQSISSPQVNSNNLIQRYYTVDEIIDYIGDGSFQYRLLFLTGSVWAADAMEMMLLSFLLPTLEKEWNLTGIQVSFVGSIVFFGMLIGGTSLSILSDRIGRRKIVITANAGCALFGLLSGLSPNLTMMLIARFCVGIFIGGGCVGYTLFAEYAPTKKRGILLVIQQAFWSFGALFSVFLAWITLSNLNWRWYLILSSIPLWIVTCLFWLVPESPRYLYAAGKYDEAIIRLKYLAEFNDVVIPSVMINNLRMHTSVTTVDNGQICDICKPQYRMKTFLLYTILWVCVFGYYGISFISERYFEALDKSQSNIYWQMTITTTSEIPALIFGVLLIDRIGRRRTLLWSFFIFSICCILLIVRVIQYSHIIGIILVFFGRMWISLAYMVIFIYFTEYYPTWIRASALGGGIALGRTAGISTTFTAEDMTITLGMWLYGCTGIIAFIATLLLRDDTKGLPLLDRTDSHDNNQQLSNYNHNQMQNNNTNNSNNLTYHPDDEDEKQREPPLNE